MMKARLKYYESYEMGGIEREGVAVEIATADGSGWGLDCFFPLVNKYGDDDNNYVHWHILRKINDLIQYGYEITEIAI